MVCLEQGVKRRQMKCPVAEPPPWRLRRLRPTTWMRRSLQLP
jgi:hypothetical protein